MFNSHLLTMIVKASSILPLVDYPFNYRNLDIAEIVRLFNHSGYSNIQLMQIGVPLAVIQMNCGTPNFRNAFR